MSRARNIKPGFFKNEDLAELPTETRLLFIGLWTIADREGRLEDRPKRIKGELFPYDMFDVDSMLNQLQASNFVIRYEVSGARFLQVLNFVKHQDPHYKERASEIPAPPGAENLIEATGITRATRARIMERDGFMCRHCGAKDYLSIDHVVPVSRGGTGEDTNLQVLCLKCNRGKGNKLPGERKGVRKSANDDTSLRTRSNLDSTSSQVRAEFPGSVPLIPDSLIPEELHPPSPDGDGPPKRKRLAVACPPSVPDVVWSDWIAVRQAKRAGPVTATVLAALSREAGNAGLSLEAAVRTCVERGWQGFRAEWFGKLAPAESRSAAPPPEPAWRTEQRARAVAVLGPYASAEARAAVAAQRRPAEPETIDMEADDGSRLPLD